MNENVDQLKPLLAIVADGKSLSEEEAERAFEIIMTGNASPSQIGAFLMALRVRGETVDEITAAARIMRAKATHIKAPDNAMDVVGTGGDGSGSLNVSTGAALVVAGCGIPVAKHGNRALSSRAGAADVLTALSVNIECDMPLIEKSIREAGIGFMMAPMHHPAMAHVGPVRAELGTRTIFNILGPLTNPAGVKRQLTGAFSRDLILPMAQTLGQLGSECAWLVHGSDGTDELTITGVSWVAMLNTDGTVTETEVHPDAFGLPVHPFEAIVGGTPHHNATAFRDLLNGAHSAYRDAVLLNAAAALIVAGVADDNAQAVDMARHSIDSGTAKDKIDTVARITSETS